MRLHRWILAGASRLVPKSLRAEWRAEWDAELDHREAALRTWNRWHRRGRLDLLRRSAGSVWDALWLQSSHWHAIRLFTRQWRLTLTAVLSLALGVAATVVGLAISNALLFRPPGVPDPRTLLTLHVRTDSEPYGPLSFDEFMYYRDHSQTFADVAAFPYSVSTITMRAGNSAERLVATAVSDNYFSVLGVRPRLGRLVFARSAGIGDQAVLSHAFWTRLGADPLVVGTTVHLNDHPVTIVGVAPATFGRMLLVWEPDVWMPFTTAQQVLGTSPRLLTDRTERWLRLLGRLAPGVTEGQARADVEILSRRVAFDHAKTDTGRSAVVTATTVVPAGDRAWVALLSGCLFLVVVLVLIVACANVANLLLGLSTSRRHEILVRTVLGASRLQLAVPMLRESTSLALVSGVLGYGAAYVALARLSQLQSQLSRFLPAVPPPSFDVRPDALVIAATLVLTIAAGVAVGIVPACRAAADGISGALNAELSGGLPRKGRIRSVLVVSQMAVATFVPSARRYSVCGISSRRRSDSRRATSS